MPRINLLPWREQQRTDRKKAFGVGLAAAFVGALLVTALAWLLLNQMIDAQETRNALLRTEIKTLDKQIEEINTLEQEKVESLARMQIIEKLQQSRPEIVHDFETFPKIIPDGMYLTGITQTEQQFKIQGVAQSPTRVSVFMQTLDGSEWMTLADESLEKVVLLPATTGKGATGNEFIMFAKQRMSAADEAEAASKAAAAKRKKP